MFGWFKKKKVEEPFITTNPPAREITLANRKRIRDQKVNYYYKEMLTDINDAIKSGRLTSSYYLGFSQSVREYMMDDAYVYIAARQLRRDGFKIKLGKRVKTAIYDPYIGSTFSYPKHIKISW